MWLVYDLIRVLVWNFFDIFRLKEKWFFLLLEGGVLVVSESLMLLVICKLKIFGIFWELWVIKILLVLGCGLDIIVNFKVIIYSIENYM